MEGKKSLKGLFSSKKDKERKTIQLQEELKIADHDIIQFKKLNNLIDLHHGQVVVPSFKLEKASLYLKQLNNFCIKEISNAHIGATLYHSMMELANNNV